MITLYQFEPAWNLPNLSPFCLKTEVILKMMELPYEKKVFQDPRRAPKGKLPFIKDNDQVIADSAAIAQYLKETYGDKLDAHLSPLERAHSHAWRRMLEEGFYFIALHSRWGEEESWRLMRERFLKMPPPLSWFIPKLVRGSVLKSIRAQGTGRHAPAEIYAFGAADLAALSVLLGDHAFFLGDRPSSFDAVAFAFLLNVERNPVVTPLQTAISGHPNLLAFNARMWARYFG